MRNNDNLPIHKINRRGGNMSPNQLGNTTGGSDKTDEGHLTTDCPKYSSDRMNGLNLPQKREFLSPDHNTRLKDDENGSDNSSEKSHNITITSIKGNSDEDDDVSSVATDSSFSDYEENPHTTTTVHKGLKEKANNYAIDAINCASDRFQNADSTIVVNSEVRANRPGTTVEKRLDIQTGSENNGFVVSELNHGHDRNKLVLPCTTIAQTLSAQSSPNTPNPGTTTAIFNDSTDITLGNKTFITGSLTIKQYIKDTNNGGPPTNNSTLPDLESDESLRRQKLTSVHKIWILVTVLAVAAVIGGTVLMFLLDSSSSSGQLKPGDGDDSRYNIPINSSIGNDLISSGGVLRFITRDEWVAQPANNELTELELPVKRIIIAHSATENCTRQSDCVFRVRIIQTFHMESRSFDDIGYNFLVGGDGAAYEGRGWNKQGAHTKGYNKGSICIAFIGTFNTITPPKRQLTVAQRLIEEGVHLGKVHKDYKLYGHRQFYGTESPGQALYEIITKWDHWSNDIEED